MFLKRFRKPKPASDRYQSAADYVAAYRTTGDLAILGELYEQHMDLVYAVCYNYLRNEDDAKDAVMQLFEQLITDLRRHDVQQFQPWLHTVARNYCLMQLRRNHAHQTEPLLVETTDETATKPGPFWLPDNEENSTEEDLTRLEVCLETLPAEQRICLRLFYLEQKSYTDVARLTGYDLKQVKSYLQNGRRKLKICMSSKS